MVSQETPEERSNAYLYSKIQSPVTGEKPGVTAVSQDEENGVHNKLGSKVTTVKKAKVVFKQVKQKGAVFVSWLNRWLFDSAEPAYTQAYTMGFGIVGLDVGMYMDWGRLAMREQWMNYHDLTQDSRLTHSL